MLVFYIVINIDKQPLNIWSVLLVIFHVAVAIVSCLNFALNFAYKYYWYNTENIKYYFLKDNSLFQWMLIIFNLLKQSILILILVYCIGHWHLSLSHKL